MKSFGNSLDETRHFVFRIIYLVHNASFCAQNSMSWCRNHKKNIGKLSEEAQEARNRDCRRFRLCNTQKTARVNSNRDLLNMLLISSDPPY
jgi:hypothetical protein